jgi:glycosyltransferase involved in cell wall biosynthesis
LPERRAIFAIPGDLDSPTGGYAYDRRMIAELRRLGWTIEHLALSGRFPVPDTATLEETYRTLTRLPVGIPIIVDGLALGALPDIGRRLAPDHLLVAMVHHPLALESGVTPERATVLRASERSALRTARAVIVNSRATGAVLAAEFGVPAEHITVAPPGTDPATIAPIPGGDVPRLLSVGTMVPRKGFDLLVAALAALQDLPWQLTIVGDTERDPATTQAVQRAIDAARLGSRIALTGALPAGALPKHYAAADTFVLASRHEGYGMAYAEAIAHGLPVIGTTAGAIAEAVPEGTGILVPPDDVPALTEALRQMLGDAGARRRFSDAARRAALGQPRWADSAARFASALAAVRP